MDLFNCCKFRCTIILGVVIMISGVIVTLVGNFKKPLWSENSLKYCSFCRREREKSLNNLRNCKFVGPVVVGIGTFVLLVGIIRRRSYLESNPTSNRNVTVTYLTTTHYLPQHQQMVPVNSEYAQVQAQPTCQTMDAANALDQANVTLPENAATGTLLSSQGQTNYPPPPTYADATSDSNAYPEPSAPPK